MKMNYVSSVKHAGETADMDGTWVHRNPDITKARSYPVFVPYNITLKFCLHLYKGKIIDLFYTIFLLTTEQLDVRVRYWMLEMPL